MDNNFGVESIMSIKNTPFSAAMAVALLSWNITAQADNEISNDVNNIKNPENNNAVHNWMPQQPNNNFWQTPNWNSFPPATAPAQAPQAVAVEPTPQNPAVQAPALQFPTQEETSAITAPAQPEIPMPIPTSASNATPDKPAPQAEASNNKAQENMPTMTTPPQMPGYNNNYRPPMPQMPYYGQQQQQHQYNPYQRPYPPMQNVYRPYPPVNMYQGYRPPQNAYRPNPNSSPNQTPQNGQATQPNMPNNAGSPYNVPGANGYNNNYDNRNYNNGNYNGYNNRFNNNNWGGNNFWGRSGPSTWTNPNKQNMEQGWDDMINAPSRMGTMPGGWNAPEISMPNPIDMGDQFQDNIQDLPEQIRNMDVGN